MGGSKMKHKSKKSRIDITYLLMTMLKANMIAYALTASFVILGTVILTYTQLGTTFEKWLIVIGVVLSAFLAGYDMAKVGPKDGYKWGAIGGVSYFTIFLILSYLLNGFKNADMSMFVMLAVLSIIMSSVAGMFSVNTSK